MKRIPYSYKLMLSYLAFVLIAVTFIGTSAYRTSVESIREQASLNIRGILLQTKDNIEYKAEEAKRISGQLYFDNKLQSYLRHYGNGWYSYEVTQEYMIPVFSSSVKVYRDAALLKVYLMNTSMPEVYNLQDANIDPMRFSPDFEILHYGRIQNQPWLERFERLEESFRGTEYQWEQVETDAEYHNISFIRRLVDFDYKKQIGLTRTIVRLDHLLGAVDHEKIDESSVIAVESADGAVLKASGTHAGDVFSEQSREHYLVITEEMPELNMRLAAYVPNALLEKGANKVRSMTILVCLVSTLSLLAIGFAISNYFSKRVRKIVYSLGAFREGDFHKRIQFTGNDEFGDIAREFNKMADNIEELIKEVYLANLQKSEAELESLQAQINPHFLYNTLSSMSRLAKFGEIDKLHEMIMGLAKFYRLSLNKGQTLISIYNEIEQAKTYIDIQRIKYRDRLQVMYDIDPAVIRYDTVKLVLQPFVENSLEHALYGKSIHIRIVAAFADGDILFRIIDDGIGMGQATIAQIFASGSIGIGYGIRNVDARIKLQFGKEYGVSLHSIVGGGTSVSIRIPAYIDKR